MKLTITQRVRLADLEAKMEQAERHVTIYLESLQAIRDEQLYLQSHATFEEYCEKRWGKSDRHIRRLIAHEKIVQQLETELVRDRNHGSDCGQAESQIPLPAHERQTRHLNELPPERRGDAWETAVKSANGKQPTAKQVKAAVEETVDQAGELLDAEGVTIPENVVPAFEAAKDITATCREMDALLHTVEELAKGPGGRLIRFESFKQQFKDAKGNLWANRPTHVCPYCKGTGDAPKHSKDDKCECCKGEGWTAKHVWQQAPKK